MLPFRVMLIALELPCLRAAWGAHLVSGPGPLVRLVWVGSSTATLCWFHLATSAFALFPRRFMPALPRFSWVACVLPRCSTLVLQLLLIALSHLVVSGCGVWDGVLWGLRGGFTYSGLGHSFCGRRSLHVALAWGGMWRTLVGRSVSFAQ